MGTFHIYKSNTDYALTAYTNKADASIDGGSVFSYYDNGIKYLATINPSYVKYKTILFRFKDGNGNERAVLQDRVQYGATTYLNLSNITSRTITIPSDRCRCGGQVDIIGGCGWAGNSGKYSSGGFTGGDGGTGGGGGKGLCASLPTGTVTVYGGGGGGGGGGGKKDIYDKIVITAGKGGNGGIGEYNTIGYRGSWAGKTITLSTSTNYDGKNGSEGSRGSNSSVGNGGAGGASGDGVAGGARSGGNGGNGANTKNGGSGTTSNYFALLEYVY